MVKKVIGLFIIAISMFGSLAYAKSEECAVKPTYDIVIAQNTISIVSNQKNLVFKKNGDIFLNNQMMKLDGALQNNSQIFQQNLRQQLPAFEQDAISQLNNLHQAFAKAIDEKLGKSKELNRALDDLSTQLQQLLKQTIMTENNITYFHHHAFNHIHQDGEEIGKSIFYHLIGDSILNFNVFKNYSAIKKIAKQEWKEQKEVLKSFNQQTCQLMSEIDEQYHDIISALE